MSKLELIFESSDKKVKTLQLAYARTDVSEQVARTQMDKIAALKMFDNDGINPYAKPLAARYTETTHASLFDNRK